MLVYQRVHPGTLTARTWEYTFAKGKTSEPNHHLQVRFVRLRGCVRVATRITQSCWRGTATTAATRWGWSNDWDHIYRVESCGRMRFRGGPLQVFPNIAGWKMHHEWRYISYWKIWWSFYCHLSLLEATPPKINESNLNNDGLSFRFFSRLPGGENSQLPAVNLHPLWRSRIRPPEIWVTPGNLVWIYGFFFLEKRRLGWSFQTANSQLYDFLGVHIEGREGDWWADQPGGWSPKNVVIVRESTPKSTGTSCRFRK